MLIGRQEQMGLGGRIDLLAITPDGSPVLIEVKRDRTPREVVAQALDYAAWVEAMTAERVVQIYQRVSSGGNLTAAFQQRFGTALDEDTLNASHQIIIVAAALDEQMDYVRNQHRFAAWVYAVASGHLFFWLMLAWTMFDLEHSARMLMGAALLAFGWTFTPAWS